MKKDKELLKASTIGAQKFDKTYTKRNTQNLMLKLGTRLKSLQIKPDGKAEDSLDEAEQSSSRQSKAEEEKKPPREKRYNISRSFSNLVSWHALAKEKDEAKNT